MKTKANKIIIQNEKKSNIFLLITRKQTNSSLNFWKKIVTNIVFVYFLFIQFNVNINISKIKRTILPNDVWIIKEARVNINSQCDNNAIVFFGWGENTGKTSDYGGAIRDEWPVPSLPTPTKVAPSHSLSDAEGSDFLCRWKIPRNWHHNSQSHNDAFLLFDATPSWIWFDQASRALSPPPLQISLWVTEPDSGRCRSRAENSRHFPELSLRTTDSTTSRSKRELIILSIEEVRFEASTWPRLWKRTVERRAIARVTWLSISTSYADCVSQRRRKWCRFTTTKPSRCHCG